MLTDCILLPTLRISAKSWGTLTVSVNGELKKKKRSWQITSVTSVSYFTILNHRQANCSLFVSMFIWGLRIAKIFLLIFKLQIINPWGHPEEYPLREVTLLSLPLTHPHCTERMLLLVGTACHGQHPQKTPYWQLLPLPRRLRFLVCLWAKWCKN